MDFTNFRNIINKYNFKNRYVSNFFLNISPALTYLGGKDTPDLRAEWNVS